MNDKTDEIKEAVDILQTMLDLTESGEMTFCDAWLLAVLGPPPKPPVHNTDLCNST